MIISIIRTIILYAFVIFAIRLMGKRQISELQPTELVITMIIIRLIPCIIQMIRFIKREKIADKGKIFIISKIGKTKEKLLDRFRTK